MKPLELNYKEFEKWISSNSPRYTYYEERDLGKKKIVRCLTNSVVLDPFNHTLTGNNTDSLNLYIPKLFKFLPNMSINVYKEGDWWRVINYKNNIKKSINMKISSNKPTLFVNLKNYFSKHREVSGKLKFENSNKELSISHLEISDDVLFIYTPEEVIQLPKDKVIKCIYQDSPYKLTYEDEIYSFNLEMKDPLNIERKLDNLESLKEDDDKIKVLSRDSFLSKLSTRKLKCCHLIKRIDNRVINYTPVSRIQIKNINEVKCFLKDQTEVVCLRLTSNPTGLLGRYTRVSIVSKYGYLVVSNGNLINDRDDTITELWINLCEDSIENILNKWTGSSIKLHSYNDQIEEEDNAKLESLTHNLITRSHGMISKEDLIIKGSFDGYSMYIPTKTSILEISITEQPDLDIECSMHIKTDLFD